MRYGILQKTQLENDHLLLCPQSRQPQVVEHLLFFFQNSTQLSTQLKDGYRSCCTIFSNLPITSSGLIHLFPVASRTIGRVQKQLYDPSVLIHSPSMQLLGSSHSLLSTVDRNHKCINSTDVIYDFYELLVSEMGVFPDNWFPLGTVSSKSVVTKSCVKQLYLNA